MTFEQFEYELSELRDKCIKYKKDGCCKYTDCRECDYQNVCDEWSDKIGKSIDETIEILQGRDKCMNKLKPGDMIECVDKEDMVETMMQLAQEDVETEFVYEREMVLKVIGWR